MSATIWQRHAKRSLFSGADVESRVWNSCARLAAEVAGEWPAADIPEPVCAIIVVNHCMGNAIKFTRFGRISSYEGSSPEAERRLPVAACCQQFNGRLTLESMIALEKQNVIVRTFQSIRPNSISERPGNISLVTTVPVSWTISRAWGESFF